MIRANIFFFSSDNLNYRVIFYCYCFESFNGGGIWWNCRGEICTRERINRTLWTHALHTFKQLSRASLRESLDPVFRVALFIHALQIKHEGDRPMCARARQISHDGDEKWRQLILWFLWLIHPVKIHSFDEGLGGQIVISMTHRWKSFGKIWHVASCSIIHSTNMIYIYIYISPRTIRLF